MAPEPTPKPAPGHSGWFAAFAWEVHGVGVVTGLVSWDHNNEPDNASGVVVPACSGGASAVTSGTDRSFSETSALTSSSPAFRHVFTGAGLQRRCSHREGLR